MSALIKAIIATAEEIGQLAKTEFNPHSSYNYVGIDAFYERVAPVARKNGIVWTISETDPPTPLDGRAVMFHFEVVLRCVGSDGEGGVMSETIPMRISVPHNWQGAQTAGSASSYAIKTILRAVFAVRTGEPDADSQANFEPSPPTRPKSSGKPERPGASGLPPTAAPAPAADPPPAAGAPTMAELEPILDSWFEGNLPVMIDPGGDPAYPWDIARDVMLSNIIYVTDPKKITEWWRANIAVMEQMEKFDPNSYKAVAKAFETHRRSLKK